MIILVNGPFGVGKTAVSREGQQWRLEHLAERPSTFSDPYFGAEVRTGGKQPDEIAPEICEELP